jgi:Beta-propeller repeat
MESSFRPQATSAAGFEAGGIAVDGSGNAYLAGDTISSDFPRVNQIPGACQGADRREQPR